VKADGEKMNIQVRYVEAVRDADITTREVEGDGTAAKKRNSCAITHENMLAAGGPVGGRVEEGTVPKHVGSGTRVRTYDMLMGGAPAGLRVWSSRTHLCAIG
jgi:hypothetical protein